MKHTYITQTPIGNIQLTFVSGKVTQLHYLDDNITSIKPQSPDHPSIQELQEYFKNPKKAFQHIEIPDGTPFQQKVWKALLEIPCGELLTYGDLAKKLESSPRAVGQACRNNPLPIFIPCHRVIGKQNKWGYAGSTSGKLSEIKKWLLQHEGVAS